MATHTSFVDESAPGGNATSIRNLIDVVTKLASELDQPYRAKYSNKPDEIISHFTRWRHLSIKQKAKILDLIIGAYNSNLCNPETDFEAKTDPSFIPSTDLQKISTEFSAQLLEGSVLLREKTEDMLGFYFTVNIDKFSAFGQTSRDLAKYIEYRIPYIYRNNATLQEHCKLFANTIASVIIERANLTPFRRGYSGNYKTSYRPFTLKADAEYPFLLGPVEATRGPIEPIASATDGLPRHPASNLVPTAPNSPAHSQRTSGLHRQVSFWSGGSDINFTSKEVHRALDEAERWAGASVWRPRSNLQPVIENSDSSTAVSEVDSNREDLSSVTDISTTTGSSTGSYQHVNISANHISAGSNTENAASMQARTPSFHAASPINHSLSPAPAHIPQGLSYLLPTSFMIVSNPGTPQGPDRRSENVGPSNASPEIAGLHAQSSLPPSRQSSDMMPVRMTTRNKKRVHGKHRDVQNATQRDGGA